MTIEDSARDEAIKARRGALAQNVLLFARALRRAGLSVGVGAALEGVEALRLSGLGRRDDVKAALEAVMLTRRSDQAVFDGVFASFWRPDASGDGSVSFARPDAPAQNSDTQPPSPEAPVETPAGAGRAAEAYLRTRERAVRGLTERHSRPAASADERLRKKDFGQMTADEITEARRLVARLPLTFEENPTRRWRPHPRGSRIDARATLRLQLRAGGRGFELARRMRRTRLPPLVILCDISGSMAPYARIVLPFAHAILQHRRSTQVFLFGTRLTNVTRALRGRDVDDALARLGKEAKDWSGGTRIAASLHRFNQEWSRRVLGPGAIVVLFTDGLDRDESDDLGAEMRRLRASCRRLIWLNPLLRYAGFEPKAKGVRAMLPHVDEFRAVHTLQSLEDLCNALAAPPTRLARIPGEPAGLKPRPSFRLRAGTYRSVKPRDQFMSG